MGKQPPQSTRRPPLNSGDDLHELFHFKVYFVFRSRMYYPFCQVNYALSAVHRKLRGEVFLDELWGLARSTRGLKSFLGDVRETIRDGWGRGQSPLPKELCSKNQVTQESMALQVSFWVPQCRWTPKHPAQLRIRGFPQSRHNGFS